MERFECEIQAIECIICERKLEFIVKAVKPVQYSRGLRFSATMEMAGKVMFQITPGIAAWNTSPPLLARK